MENLKVTIVQSPLYWEDIDANIKMFSTKLDALKTKTDLIVLPEMFTTGFTMNVKKCAEGMNGKAVAFLKEYAQKLNAYLCGSAIIKSGNKYYNRLIVSSSKGEIKYYDKRHLFRMAKENSVYSEGRKLLTIKIKNCKIAFFVCYDLRFPVWSRNKNNYDIAVYSSNWPKERNYYWKTLLLARAIENQCYIVGVNRTGRDGNGYEFSGDSAVISPYGKYILNAKSKSGLFTAELDLESLDKFRKKFPVWKDADKYKISL